MCVCFQEYEEYYYVKFKKNPKITKKQSSSGKFVVVVDFIRCSFNLLLYFGDYLNHRIIIYLLHLQFQSATAHLDCDNPFQVP